MSTNSVLRPGGPSSTYLLTDPDPTSFSSSANLATVYSPWPTSESFAATLSRQRTCSAMSEVRKEKRASVGESRFSWNYIEFRIRGGSIPIHKESQFRFYTSVVKEFILFKESRFTIPYFGQFWGCLKTIKMSPLTSQQCYSLTLNWLDTAHPPPPPPSSSLSSKSISMSLANFLAFRSSAWSDSPALAAASSSAIISWTRRPSNASTR